MEIQDKYGFDLPPITLENDWHLLRQSLFKNAGLFIRYEKMSNAKLDGIVVGEKYGTYYRNIEDAIDHSYYHLGQIPLIVKLLK